MKGKGPTAIYSVRKFKEDEKFWDSDGNPALRPYKSQGSEDFVYSIISSIVKSDPNFLDHPSINLMKTKKVRNIILIDDASGSGDRISTYINKMMELDKIKSWWSYGKFKFHILTYTRNENAEKKIVDSLYGSDHHSRKYPKSKKITFYSEYIYNEKYIKSRWGENYSEIEELCKKIINIPKRYALGYGNVMSNLLFYHSVPNNIPAVFWCQTTTWNALFPGRTLPEWTMRLLNTGTCQQVKPEPGKSLSTTSELFKVLTLVKRGVRTFAGISFRLSLNREYVKVIMNRGIELGMISDAHRLTPVGENAIHSATASRNIDTFDRSLYVPETWCTDQIPFSR